MPAAVFALRFVVGLGLLAVGPAVFAGMLVRLGLAADGADVAASVEDGALAWLLACGLVVAFAAWQPPAQPWRPVRAARVLGSYAPFVLAWAAVLLGWLALARWLGVEVVPQAPLVYLAAGEVTRPGFWLVVVGITLGAPLAEEIVFRGYLQGALLGALRPGLAIAVTALLFGWVHTLPYALPVALLGALFGWLAWRIGSLWPAVLAHALHNAVTVAVTVLWPESLTFLYRR